MLSAVILTKNEEKNIIDCIEHLNFVDEIIVVDDNSTDRTIDIVKNLPNKNIQIFTRAMNSDFSAQRNFALEKVTGVWVLYVDADERVEEKLRRDIQRAVAQSDFDAYKVIRKDIMWGHTFQYGETGNIRFVRLAKKGSGKWKGTVHEEWNVKGRIGLLSGNLLHYPHPTISEFLTEIDTYTTLRANELYKEGIRVKPYEILLYPVGKFVTNYFVKQGFRDGVPGFIHATLMSLHSYLVRGKVLLNEK